jgi:hypothetical protein
VSETKELNEALRSMKELENRPSQFWERIRLACERLFISARPGPSRDAQSVLRLGTDSTEGGVRGVVYIG